MIWTRLPDLKNLRCMLWLCRHINVLHCLCLTIVVHSVNSFQYNVDSKAPEFEEMEIATMLQINAKTAAWPEWPSGFISIPKNTVLNSSASNTGLECHDNKGLTSISVNIIVPQTVWRSQYIIDVKEIIKILENQDWQLRQGQNKDYIAACTV